MLFGLAAVLLWSTVATAFKLALSHLTPLQLLAIASLTSLVLLAGITLQRHPLSRILACWRANPWHFVLLGSLNPCVYYLVLLQAYDLLPAQQAQPLNYTWALVLSVLAVPLLGQKLHRSDGIALLLGYVGVLVIATRGDLLGLAFDSVGGVLLALLSTVIWALYWIVNVRQQSPADIALLLCFAVGTPLVWLAMLLVDGLPGGYAGVGSAIYVGLFEMGITFLLWMRALQLATHTSRVSNLIFLAPFISLLLIHFILGEHIGLSTFIGLVLIVLAVAYQQYQGKTSA